MWEVVQRRVVRLIYISTIEQVVDVLTKPLSRIKFTYFYEKPGMVENSS